MSKLVGIVAFIAVGVYAYLAGFLGGFPMYVKKIKNLDFKTCEELNTMKDDNDKGFHGLLSIHVFYDNPFLLNFIVGIHRTSEDDEIIENIKQEVPTLKSEDDYKLLFEIWYNNQLDELGGDARLTGCRSSSNNSSLNNSSLNNSSLNNSSIDSRLADMARDMRGRS